eukprot:491249_1
MRKSFYFKYLSLLTMHDCIQLYLVIIIYINLTGSMVCSYHRFIMASKNKLNTPNEQFYCELLSISLNTNRLDVFCWYFIDCIIFWLGCTLRLDLRRLLLVLVWLDSFLLIVSLQSTRLHLLLP